MNYCYKRHRRSVSSLSLYILWLDVDVGAVSLVSILKLTEIVEHN